jgi:hypothetical protein
MRNVIAWIETHSQIALCQICVRRWERTYKPTVQRLVVLPMDVVDAENPQMR